MAVAEKKNQFVTAELGIAAGDALWVVEKSGKKKALADHETHNVKEGDHFEALVKGGVS